MRNHLDALVPIFLDAAGERFSLLGSGVLIEFREEVFIITAGHVIDGFERGHLMVPSSDSKINYIKGVCAHINPKGSRELDYLDFGYFKLDECFANDLKNIFYAVPEREFGIKKTYFDKELMSFGGYPYRKSNVAGKVATTKEYIYGVYHASTSDYEVLSCSSETNIVTKFNRKKAINPKNAQVQIAPLPHGISGGGIFVWPAVP